VIVRALEKRETRSEKPDSRDASPAPKHRKNQSMRLSLHIFAIPLFPYHLFHEVQQGTGSTLEHLIQIGWVPRLRLIHRQAGVSRRFI
jgi:hypothetical protein